MTFLYPAIVTQMAVQSLAAFKERQKKWDAEFSAATPFQQQLMLIKKEHDLRVARETQMVRPPEPVPESKQSSGGSTAVGFFLGLICGGK